MCHDNPLKTWLVAMILLILCKTMLNEDTLYSRIFLLVFTIVITYSGALCGVRCIFFCACKDSKVSLSGNMGECIFSFSQL